MESRMNRNAGVLELMRLPAGSMGLSRFFAAFSQGILDKYAIWEKYPWSDAVIRYLENEKQEEASDKEEPSPFFVTVQLLKVYLDNERKAGKADEEAQKIDRAELSVRIETQLQKLKSGYDMYFGILERLYREGAQMPAEEFSRIWGIIDREVVKKYPEAGDPDKPGIAIKQSGIMPHALGMPGIRMHHMLKGHARIPDGKTLFRNSVQRQQREFYTELLRNHVVRETARLAERHLGRELYPSEYQALKDYGNGLGQAELVFYVQKADAALYRETARLVLGQAGDSETLSWRVPQEASIRDEIDRENGDSGWEEIHRILLELPVCLSERAVRELYGEKVGDYGTKTVDSKNVSPKIVDSETGIAVLREYGEELVYRMENGAADTDAVSHSKGKSENSQLSEILSRVSGEYGKSGSPQLSEIWRLASYEEKKILLQRIPYALRQVASVRKETSQGDGVPSQDEILRTIVERIEAVQSVGVMKGLGAFRKIASTQGVGEGQELEAIPGQETLRRPDVEIWYQRNLEEIGRILSELPIWVSERAVKELYSENAGNYETKGVDSKNVSPKIVDSETGIAVLREYGEELVYRMENRDADPDDVSRSEMTSKNSQLSEILSRIFREYGTSGSPQLSEIWNLASYDERKILLQRIPQAVRQAASLWVETVQGNGGSRQEEILKTIVERLEVVQSVGGYGTKAVDSKNVSPKIMDSETGIALLREYGEELVYRMKNRNADPDDVSRSEITSKKSQLSEILSRVFGEYGTSESPQLSEIWNLASYGERKILLQRIPQAVRQVTSLWEKSIEERLRRLRTEEITAEKMRRLRTEETARDGSLNRVSKESSALEIFTRIVSRIWEPHSETSYRTASEMRLDGITYRTASEMRLDGITYHIGSEMRLDGATYHASPEIQMDGGTLQYAERGENAIVYAVKEPESPDVRQSGEDMQVIHELESRISRQEYIIRQEQLEREELMKKMKKQESRGNTVWKAGNMEITSKSGAILSQNVLSQLQEQFRLERIRYGAD